MTEAHRFRVAAIQMVSGPEPQENLAAAGALIAEAAAGGAELVLLPEYFALISPDERAKLALAEAPGEGPIQHFLADCARRHGIWLVGGTLPLRSDDPERVRNTSLVFNPQGQQCARYDKIHLFRFARGNESYDEARSIEAGREVVSFAAPCGRVGLSVCYDLRFPELYRQLGDCALLLVPAAFTATTGRAHWEVLLRARAIENQCYVLACGQGGRHPGGRETWGHSMLVDPWGEVLGCRASGAGVMLADLDPQRLAAVRASLPALEHRALR